MKVTNPIEFPKAFTQDNSFISVPIIWIDLKIIPKITKKIKIKYSPQMDYGVLSYQNFFNLFRKKFRLESSEGHLLDNLMMSLTTKCYLKVFLL